MTGGYMEKEARVQVLHGKKTMASADGFIVEDGL